MEQAEPLQVHVITERLPDVQARQVQEAVSVHVTIMEQQLHRILLAGSARVQQLTTDRLTRIATTAMVTLHLRSVEAVLMAQVLHRQEEASLEVVQEDSRVVALVEVVEVTSEEEDNCTYCGTWNIYDI